jgi:hypothetical protein
MTETVKTEVQRTPDEVYGVTEMRFLCASQIVIRSTGEIVKITDKMKLVYIYMKNQFIGFSSREQQFTQTSDKSGSFGYLTRHPEQSSGCFEDARNCRDCWMEGK